MESGFGKIYGKQTRGQTFWMDGYASIRTSTMAYFPLQGHFQSRLRPAARPTADSYFADRTLNVSYLDIRIAKRCPSTMLVLRRGRTFPPYNTEDFRRLTFSVCPF